MADFTEDDVRLVAEAMQDPFRFAEANARDVLAALRDAGRLLPSGARVVEELGVRVDKPHPLRKEQKAGQVIRGLERATALGMPKLWDGWIPVTRRAIKWAGPWVPVGEEQGGGGHGERRLLGEKETPDASL